jgi:hypothetical protein
MKKREKVVENQKHKKTRTSYKTLTVTINLFMIFFFHSQGGFGGGLSGQSSNAAAGTQSFNQGGGFGGGFGGSGKL